MGHASDLQRFAAIDGAHLVPVTDLHRSPVGSCLARPRLYDRFCGQLLGSETILHVLLRRVCGDLGVVIETGSITSAIRLRR